MVSTSLFERFSGSSNLPISTLKILNVPEDKVVESPPFQGGIKRVRVPSGIQLTGCISVGRLLALDARGRWFESTHPDNLGY